MSECTPTADLYDEFEEALKVVEPGFNDYGGIVQFCGAARTVKLYEDNSLVRELLGTPGEGQVLVVDGGASMRCALLGDNLAQLGIENHWVGIVINGCIRDSAVIAKMPIGVKALATNPRKSVKRGEGQVGIPLYFGGVSIHDGDTIYCDTDGIVIKPKS